MFKYIKSKQMKGNIKKRLEFQKGLLILHFTKVSKWMNLVYFNEVLIFEIAIFIALSEFNNYIFKIVQIQII